MKTDKELLELAAKAIGYDTNHPMNTERCELAVPIDDLWVTCDGNLVSTGWNPLKDDGHALRLAVLLKMSMQVDELTASAACYASNDLNDSDRIEICVLIEGSSRDSIRRAIVRAAAAIGEKL